MQEIKKIKVFSLAKILALFGVLIGLVQGILMGNLAMQYAREDIVIGLGEAISYIAENPAGGISPIFLALGWWSVIVAPIVLGLSYFVSGIILSLIFNLFSKLIGGVKIELAETKETKKRK